jgi:hypothetical protein
MENKTYPRQKKEPEMLNDFGPAGGYDCLYPSNEEKLAKKNSNKVMEPDKAEVELDDVGSNGCDIIDIGEEVKELGE